MTDVPNQPKTPVRGIRVPDDRWEAAQAKAAREDTTVSAVVNELLEAWVAEDSEAD